MNLSVQNYVSARNLLFLAKIRRVSHLKERNEKNCLNCNAQVHGRFCHVCGQENVETRESAWQLTRHFLEDLTHFDGKFFSTYRHIALRPGFLPQEYFRGRRASYLNPLRMYIFTSAVFFLIFFSITASTMNEPEQMDSWAQMKKDVRRQVRSNEKALGMLTDSFARSRVQVKIDTLLHYQALLDQDSLTGVPAYHAYQLATSSGLVSNEYKSVAVYDSIQASLPKQKRDNWLSTKVNRKLVASNAKYRQQGVDPEKKLIDKFLHSFPQLLFLSLPLTSLILSLLYVRRRAFFYVHHLIFTVYLYIFTFVFALFLLGLNELGEWTDWSWLNWVVVIGGFVPWFYQYKAMRRFYGQSRWKTGLKFVLYNFLTLFLILMLFALFFFISVFQLS